jgi:DNA-binding NtrC family response regulator
MTDTRRHILIVDDDRAMRDMLIALLEDEGHVASGADCADVAIERLADEEFDVVISDIKMPGRSGIEMLGHVRELRPDTPVIMMTAFGSIDSAVESMQAGAFDYITKPFKRDAILVRLDRAFERRSLERENRELRRAVDRTSSFGELIGGSASMREIFALIRKVADARVNVLITGESGTGKELVARTLHFAGSRKDKPLVPINCTALPEGLLESELFGHVRGAFTGAVSTKRGLFEEAAGGTLFLDEIGDMSPMMQSKLLRVLQDGMIRPVGGNQSRRVDVRIISATNRNLKADVESGRFREDLYYRLNVVPIAIPPLRERPDDIPLLAEEFVRKHGGERVHGVTSEALTRLRRYGWPGNARELENVIERSVALSEGGSLDAIDILLPDQPGESGSISAHGFDSLLAEAVAEGLTLSELDERYTEQVLKSTNGNKARAAKILGINRRTLYRRGFGAGCMASIEAS